MSVSHFKLTQASLVALATTVIGQLVAFVPAFAPDKQILISAVSGLIAVAFLIANAVHALASSKVTVTDLQAAAEQATKAAVGSLDLNALARDALAGNLSAAVRTELQKVLGLAVNQSSPQAVTSTRPAAQTTVAAQAAAAQSETVTGP